MKTNYAAFAAMTAEKRTAELKKHAGTATSRQKTLAKILVAMLAANDCDEKSLKDYAAKACGCDIRTELQGVYQLVIVFGAIVDARVNLTEAEFDEMEGSKLALIATFLKKDSKLGEHAEGALEKLRNGATAQELRDFRKEVNPSKSRKEVGESGKQGVPVAFAITDIGVADPILESDMLRKKIRHDALIAYHAGDNETLDWHAETTAKMLIAFAQLAERNPVDVLNDMLAKAATQTAGTVVDVSAIPEAAAAA